ncbi:MAG: enoyl-CoA hydratase/isomerase family protein [Pseudomonadota bacterium]
MSNLTEEYGFQDLTYERAEHDRGAVVTVTLNRPKVTNALSVRLSDEFARSISIARDDIDAKVFVVRGAGGNFCAGDDLTEMASGGWGVDANSVIRRVRIYQDMANALEELDKITIASVEGYCVGGGLEITMACDFVICADTVRWGMPEVDWGITPGWGGTTRMARLIGRRMTKEINMLGALHKPQRGVELGLFNRVVPQEALDQSTKALTELILMKNQQGLRQFKVMINRGVEADLYTAQGFELMGAGLTSAVLGAWNVPDGDDAHGWTAYHSGAADRLIRKRRETARDFWTD